MARLNFVKPSYIRHFMKERGMRVSKTYIEALDREVGELMDKHSRVAKADRRKTVQVVDIDLPRVVASLSRDLHR